MIEIIQVTKENGELTATKMQPFRVGSMEEVEAKRKELQKKYGTKIYFTYRVKE